MRTEAELLDRLAVLATRLQTVRMGPAGWDDVATIASETMPGVDGAGIAVSCADGSWETRSCRWSLAEESVRIQFDLGEGPCLDALDGGSLVVVDDLSEDDRWSVYGPKMAGTGIRAQLAVELTRVEGRRAVLCLSSLTAGTFTPARVQLARIFASHASLAVRCLGAVESMGKAVSTRGTVGQAIGIVMERYQLDDKQAFQYLVRLSQTQNVKLRAIAEDFVAEGNRPSAAAS